MPTHDAAAGGASPGGVPAPARPDPVKDDELIRRMAGGEAPALADLYDRYAGAVFSLSARIVQDEAEAGRVVQKVFAYAWKQASRYDPARASVAGWLLEAARGASIDRARAARPAGASASQSGGEVGAPATAKPATLLLPTPAGASGYKACTPAEAGRLREALAGLPVLQRLAIELAYFEGLTVAQIADQLEQPEATINDRLLTGLRSLRSTLEDGIA